MKSKTKRSLAGGKRKLGKLAVHFSSKTDDWATPQATFDQLNAQYGPFDLDAAASKKNAKCSTYFTAKDNGLAKDWNIATKYMVPKGSDISISTQSKGILKTPIDVIRLPTRVWLNPPYGREIGKWVKKAYEEAQKGCLVVALLPARTDTRYFHSYIYNKPNVETHFLKGRLKFGNAKTSAPFPSMVIVFKPSFQHE